MDHLHSDPILLKLIKHVLVDFSESAHFLSLHFIVLEFTLECLFEESLVLDANNLGNFPRKEFVLLFVAALLLGEHDYESE